MTGKQSLPTGAPGETGCANGAAETAAAVSRAECLSARSSSQGHTPRHILVVDDDPSIREINAAMLLRLGYGVDTAEDGAIAWAALNADSYDLLITDNNMPNVSGVELIRKMRADGMALPVIMATGMSPDKEFSRRPWLKPAATLIKPYSISEMLQTVKNVLRDADATAPVRQPRPVKSDYHILALDEDSDLRQLYSEVLTRHGYVVDVAEDGATGWEALQSNRYNLLITEHDLPKLNGVELVRKLRAVHMALPVVMAAGRLPTHELARDASLQLAATLEKPFAVEALVETVQNVLRATDRPSEQMDSPPDWKSPSSPEAVNLI